MLDLIWAAEFKNRDVIHQYDNDDQTKTEHLFREVLDRRDDLKRFSLLNIRTNAVYTVDLINGRLRIWSPTNKKAVVYSPPEIEVQGSKKYTYRLIYFRRVTQTMTWAGKNIGVGEPSSILYFLGFQYTNEKGENVKKMIQINKDDEVYIS